MKNFYPDGHVMPGGDGSGERHPTSRTTVRRTPAENLSTTPRTYSLVKFNSHRKRGKAGSPPATTSNPYAVLKKVDWLAVFSPWYLINKAKRYTTLLLPTIFVSIFICFSGAAKAQSRPQVGAAEAVDAIVPLRVGDKVPAEFWTREHLFYLDGDTVYKTLEEYKGKPILLDFWATWCGACIQRFPENERMQKALRDRMPFILVNSDHKYDNIEKIARVLNDTSHFAGNKGGSIIFDSYLKQLFPHQAIPNYVWIDYRGRVRGITIFDFVTLEQMKSIIDRRKGARRDD